MLFLNAALYVFQGAGEGTVGLHLDGNESSGKLQGFCGAVVQAPCQVGSEGGIAAAGTADDAGVGELFIVALAMDSGMNAGGMGDDNFGAAPACHDGGSGFQIVG